MNSKWKKRNCQEKMAIALKCFVELSYVQGPSF